MTMENTLGLGLVRQPKTVLFGPGQRRQLGPDDFGIQAVAACVFCCAVVGMCGHGRAMDGLCCR